MLVHCHMGINRGPSMAYACLLVLGWDPIEAMTAIRTARPIAAIGYAEDALDWHHRTYRDQPTPPARQLAAARSSGASRTRSTSCGSSSRSALAEASLNRPSGQLTPHHPTHPTSKEQQP